MSIHLSLLLAIPGLMASSALAPQPLSRLPSNLQPLVRALETKGFTVLMIDALDATLHVVGNAIVRTYESASECFRRRAQGAQWRTVDQ